jgi:tetratricopeptide (TPR) repeat protein
LLNPFYNEKGASLTSPPYFNKIALPVEWLSCITNKVEEKMKTKKTIYCWLILLILTATVLFANQTIQELEKKLQRVSNRGKIAVLNDLSFEYHNISVEKTLMYGKQALRLSRTLNDLRGEATALHNISIGCEKSGNFETSLENAEKSLEIFEKLGDKSDIAGSLNGIGNIYYQFGYYDKALEYFQKSLKLREEVGSKEEIASVLGNIGVVYKISGNSRKDLEYQLKALKIREEIGDERGMAVSFNNIAHSYKIQQDFKKALEYFHKSLAINERLGNKSGMAITLESIGSTYAALKNFEKALGYYRKSLKIGEETGEKMGICTSLINIGEIYLLLDNYEKALEYHLKALKLGEEIGNKHYISTYLNNIGIIYTKLRDYDKALTYLEKSLKINQDNGEEGHSGNFLALSELYSARGDYKKALEYHRLYSKKRDKEFYDRSSKQVAEMHAKYESLKKEKEIESLKKNNQIQQLMLNRQTLIRNVAIIISVLLLIIFSQFVTRYRYLFSFWKKKNYLAHYRLLNKISSGGMGDIYRARDIRSKSHSSTYTRTCAIKVLKEEYYKDEKYKRRFKNEAALIDQLQHPNIVKVLERGEYEGNLYIAMELVEGQTLARLLDKQGKIELKTALSIMIQIVDALMEIHKRGIIHRDLKPENIMIIQTDPNPVRVKVLDFGLARTQNLTRMTRTGLIMGTIFYVPPEQLSRSTVLPAGDIYSLGVIYYQVLTGDKPFSGDTAFEIARQILKKEPIEINTFHTGIPVALSILVKRMMAKTPQHRPLPEEVLTILNQVEDSIDVQKENP